MLLFARSPRRSMAPWFMDQPPTAEEPIDE
jgi:hypothetical protein